MAYPEWVEKYRRKGTNISCIKGKYYLYECTSKYDPKKKRSQKITTKYLGRITENGLIPPKKKKDVEINNILVKEYGASEAVSQLGKDIYEILKRYFPNDADKIFTIAVIRLIEKCPFKRISEAYANSYLSEKFEEIPFSSENILNFLKEFGKHKDKIVEFLKEFIESNKNVFSNIDDKTKGNIETSFKFFKNLSKQDKIYLQNEYVAESAAFINHISLMLLYSVYNRLKEYDILKSFSIDDFIQYLKYIHKVKINNTWFISEIPSGTKSLLDSINLSVTWLLRNWRKNK